MLSKMSVNRLIENPRDIKLGVLLKSEVGEINKRNIGGTEAIFLEEVEILKNFGYLVYAYARFKDGKRGIAKLYYPLLLLKLARFLEKLNIRFKFLTDWFYLTSEFIYTLQFIILNFKKDVILGYSTPLLSIFFPQRTLIVLQNLYKFPLSEYFSSRYNSATYLCCSRNLRNQTIKLNPFLSKNRLKVLYNAVDTNLFRPITKFKARSGGLKLLYASAWSKEKGLDLLLDALLLLSENIRKKITLTVASSRDLWYSDFPEDNQKFLKGISKKIRKCDNVEMYGGIPRTKLPAVYNEHDYLVFPSVWQEPFGLVVLESLACGTPVITFASGGIGEIVDDSNSVTIRDKNAEALSAVLLKVYKRQVLVKKRGMGLLTDKNVQMKKEYKIEKLTKFIGETVPRTH